MSDPAQTSQFFFKAMKKGWYYDLLREKQADIINEYQEQYPLIYSVIAGKKRRKNKMQQPCTPITQDFYQYTAAGTVAKQ